MVLVFRSVAVFSAGGSASIRCNGRTHPGDLPMRFHSGLLLRPVTISRAFLELCSTVPAVLGLCSIVLLGYLKDLLT